MFCSLRAAGGAPAPLKSVGIALDCRREEKGETLQEKGGGTESTFCLVSHC